MSSSRDKASPGPHAEMVNGITVLSQPLFHNVQCQVHVKESPILPDENNAARYFEYGGTRT